ncbi:MAG: hypothetical protein AAGF45_04965 [Pseudomonadota bacterium]
MKSLVFAAAALASAFSMLAADAVTAPAHAVFSQPVYGKIAAITPRCSQNPDYPIIGRVAGYYSGFGRSQRLSWVGCFPNARACETWRRAARSEINPPINLNECTQRF